MKRQFPRISELRPLMQFGRPGLDRRAARLARAADIDDLRTLAQRRTPRPAFDYVDGAAGQELTARRTREAFASTEMLPRILHGTAAADLSTPIAGGTSALPFGIAPTGFTRFMHAEGEDGGAAAAAAAGIPFTLSTMGTRSLEQVAEVSDAVAMERHGSPGTRWFQLYLWKDRQRSLDLIERAAAAGFGTLMVTVDTPVAGNRLRDVRNGMTIPPRLGLKTVLDASHRPEWWFNFLTTDPLTFASLSTSAQDLQSIISSMFDPTLSIRDLEWIRSVWPGRLFVKGVLTAEDTRRSLDAGADGLVVSNHGGRQLDRAPVSLKALAEVRAEAGPDVEIILDSGILTGSDIVAALALGADFTLIGRAYLYGLMAGGRQGVERAIELLAEETRVAMMLMGAATVADLRREGRVRAPWL
ncbi:alpha-hydroxy-acid oxidizing enzyme [Citricoccus zhacaiensis]|uniref:Alpha-hydroxy-acid oxidizing enzyme n=1 Tax=Citricoccus zhacaiensis TaxID=489142 RepID=A0ABQ2M6Q7_9MICC|nr:alpha-hydroxy acid oxidase [Citricoccus zhacaiensis]GGO47575.1 alpha-hydroxy-acid oxidizing enzyme [Citricoccus zhacaiensis]